ncbi:MAG: helix-turn-helix transcriptional regulator, partial [Oscillospiraceae bacterium]|nr:helix-turn-helix transcriptional regulator [Oscillospiraceae bacterium]
MDQIKTGRYISELRKSKGYTQEELGKLVGVSNKTVSRWENGNYMPDIETLRLLAKEFSVSIEELLDGKAKNAQKPAARPDPFTPKERAEFWRRNWKKENAGWFIFWGIVFAAVFIFGFLWSTICYNLFGFLWSTICYNLFGFVIFDGIHLGNAVILFDFLFGFGLYIYFYNKMCIYVDNNAYKL